MTTAEEQELLAQINRLEGRIHRHKAQQASASYPRSTYRSSPYHRGGGHRGSRGSRGHAPTFRNKTLVLNGQNGQPRSESPANANTNSTTPSGSWVSRNDRHLQLINSSVFEKDAQARASAIEETQRQNRLQQEQMEKSRFLHYVQKNGSNVPAMPSNPAPTAAHYEIVVEGIRFQITKQGSKLVRAPGKHMSPPAPTSFVVCSVITDDKNPPSATPRIALIGGVKFYRTQSGNLVRHGIAKAQRYVPQFESSAPLTTMSRLAHGIKKVDIPCRAFSWTGIVFSNNDLSRNRQSHPDWRGKGTSRRILTIPQVHVSRAPTVDMSMTPPKSPSAATGCSRTTAPRAMLVILCTRLLSSVHRCVCILPTANVTMTRVCTFMLNIPRMIRFAAISDSTAIASEEPSAPIATYSSALISAIPVTVRTRAVSCCTENGQVYSATKPAAMTRRWPTCPAMRTKVLLLMT